jgi:uncharacterized LabA/DUF88 family protein
MVFVDGENLVFRFQEMLRSGRTPRDEVVHEPDAYVWLPHYTFLAQQHQILRATYYTYAIGDDQKLSSVRHGLRQQKFARHEASFLPDNLTPCVFKKDSRSRSGKGVDIQLATDMLSHVFRGNVDSILLISGDGDYAPLLEEVRRASILVYVASLSSGFSDRLKDCSDAFSDLDGATWK